MATTVAFQPPPPHGKFTSMPTTEPSPPEYLYGSNYIGSSSADGHSPKFIGPGETYGTGVPDFSSRRKPVCLPAALRPANYQPSLPPTIPTYPRPYDTPPSSKDNSFDSKKAPSLHSPMADFTRDFAIDSGRRVSEDPTLYGNLDRSLSRSMFDLPTVTGPPTKAYWKPDATNPTCKICHDQFWFFKRRHHCRKCGHVVCHKEFPHMVPLDQNAAFHPKGKMSKCCKLCSDEYKDWYEQYSLQRHASFEPPVGDAVATKPPLKPSQPQGPVVRNEARTFRWDDDFESTF